MSNANIGIRRFSELPTHLGRRCIRFLRSALQTHGRVGNAVKAEAKPKLQALRDQAAQLNKQLDEARNATESTWDSVKNGFQKAYEATKDGFNQARQWRERQSRALRRENFMNKTKCLTGKIGIVLCSALLVHMLITCSSSSSVAIGTQGEDSSKAWNHPSPHPTYR